MKIIFDGIGGQGIKLMAHLFAGMLAKLGKEVSLTYSYDTAVEGGMITAYLIFDDKEIENPVIEEADLMIKFSDKKISIPVKKVIIEKSMCGDKKTCKICNTDCMNSEQYLFKDEAKNLGNIKLANMIALGRLFKYVNIDVDEDFLKKNLPDRFLKENIEAIKFGFIHTKE